ncbi:DUF4306 domain-containing protein [Sporosarcina sp. ANT_H38]|uniref:DUF4306 domain-containing protein n=1 Tax=Sporosarcina sp. ANT_H38 TaxID=2597358 RepID=UPI0011F0D5B1|nr:DUF4306 domain-containing protein [Sporosarcina sp. ANT_H38]KAA0965676.1 DUF4306 domain-containing protein [Sporosarcina sp. ANT_H38]
MKKLIVLIFLLFAFAYSIFLTSWTGSYIMIEANWKNHIVFIPEKATEPQQIYEIDKLIYAFKIDPLLSIVCVSSFLLLIGFIVFWISKRFLHKPKV